MPISESKKDKTQSGAYNNDAYAQTTISKNKTKLSTDERHKHINDTDYSIILNISARGTVF